MRGLALCALFAAALAYPAACRAAQPGPDPRAVAASVSQRLHVQDRLPGGEAAWNSGETRIGGGAAEGAVPQNAGAATSWIFTALLVFGAVCAVVFVIASLPQSAGARGSSDADGAEHGAARPARPHEVLASADELAAAGRYTEAMHQLLSDALAVLRRRLDAELSDALTSREILRALSLQPPQQNALRDMIARVEATWFAKRAAAVADYDAVRASFQIFTAAGAARR